MALPIFLTLTFALAGCLLLRVWRREPVAVDNAASAAPLAPRRITNPRRLAPSDVKVWTLRACSHCDLTHSLLDGHRYTTEKAPALPGMGCDLSHCACRYEPVSESRSSERRHSDERRDQIRFQAKADRRRHQDRRESDGWRHTLVR
jgi:hypothetical protein